MFLPEVKQRACQRPDSGPIRAGRGASTVWVVTHHTRQRQYKAAHGSDEPQKTNGTSLADIAIAMKVRTSNVGYSLLLGLCNVATAIAQNALQPLDAIHVAAKERVNREFATSQRSDHVIHVTTGTIDSRLRLPVCSKPLEAFMPASRSPAARFPIGVRCTQPTWTIYVPVSITSELPVLALKIGMPRDGKVSAADVERVPRQIPGLATEYLTDVSALDGRHLRIGAGSGTALTYDLLVKDILVRRGQRVTLVASAGSMEIQAQGEALTDSSSTGRVRVVNLSSRKIVEGQAESSDRVRIGL
jgi:flagellar basal body P-ring formation protein FlgA